MTKKRLLLILKILGITVGSILFVVGGYIGYMFATYHRVPDKTELTIVAGSQNTFSDPITTGQAYSLMTYNVGFGAYTPDYSFFMDGGKSSWAVSKESAIATIDGACGLIQSYHPDFVMLEEVDVDATRTYHINQYDQINHNLSDYNSAFSIDYDSSFLMYPLTEPHGCVKAGLVLYSRYPITSSLRRSLPVSTTITKFFDLDRCYSISRIPVANGKELVLMTLHLSAYGNSDAIRDGQTSMLIADMEAEYAKGNYVIVGGDFNHDLLADENASSDSFGWAYPFPRSKLSEHFAFAHDFLSDKERNSLWHTSRNADIPYDPDKSFTVMIDGFIISDNVTMIKYENINTGYLYSDHDPVLMQFFLN